MRPASSLEALPLRAERTRSSITLSIDGLSAALSNSCLALTASMRDLNDSSAILLLIASILPAARRGPALDSGRTPLCREHLWHGFDFQCG